MDIPKDNVHVPSGTVDRSAVYGYCQSYEQAIEDAGGLDYQILGIGRTGHIGFNEPGSTRDSLTRLVTLDALTRLDAARDFPGEANVPLYAITMGRHDFEGPQTRIDGLGTVQGWGWFGMVKACPTKICQPAFAGPS